MSAVDPYPQDRHTMLPTAGPAFRVEGDVVVVAKESRRVGN